MGARDNAVSSELAGFASAAEGAIAKGDPVGLVTLVWRNGEIRHFEAQGKRNVESNAPMQRDTIFRIASMTKPVTSALALMLMEEGRLRLDDPIIKWAPEFAARRVLKDPAGAVEDTVPAPRDITIEDLLTHRAGLAYEFTSTGPIAGAYRKALGDLRAIKLDSNEFLAAIATLPLTYAPGERWHYSHATDVLGFILERIAGPPFRELLFARVLEPLAMVDTDFWIPPAKQSRAAGVATLDEKTGMPTAVSAPRDVVPKFCGGGGALVSTADDYLKFAQMLLGKGEANGVRLMKPETVALMTTNRLTPAQAALLARTEPQWDGEGFGLGVGIDIDANKREWIGPTSNGAYGWPGSFGTWFRIDPAENMIMLYLVQCVVPFTPENIVRIATGKGTPLEPFQKLAYAVLRT
jgi:CubicO group peptidase (beta-lactamase class C family)